MSLKGAVWGDVHVNRSSVSAHQKFYWDYLPNGRMN